jgi:hypothetical protein
MFDGRSILFGTYCCWLRVLHRLLMGVLGGFVSLGRMLERRRRVLFAGLMIFVAAVFRGCVVTLGCVLMVLRSSEMCFSWHQSTPFNSFLGPRDGVGESWEAPRR